MIATALLSDEEHDLLERDIYTDNSKHDGYGPTLSLLLKGWVQRLWRLAVRLLVAPYHIPSVRQAWRQRLVFVVLIALLLVAFTVSFRPSYTYLPVHYRIFRDAILASQEPGRSNPLNERIFIAASIYDQGGHLASGQWGEQLVALVDLLGPDNAFVSIYENDSGIKGRTSMLATTRVYLRFPFCHYARWHLKAETDPLFIRNTQSSFTAPSIVPLKPNAAQLLFSTHARPNGKTDYLAACAVDFINPIKFYDTFATRDLQGYGIGLPFYPFFSSAGMGQSRQDVLDQKDAVRVKSCWGSMVSWDARFFQTSSFQATESVADATVTKPLRFRAEPDLYYDASECCLIHADLLNTAQRYDIDNTGIYSNPYVRVSYTAWQLPWLRLSRRFERLYAGPHWLITKLAGMPWHNPYRTIKLGDEFENEVWVPNQDLDSGGSWQVNVQKARSSPDAGYLTTAE